MTAPQRAWTTTVLPESDVFLLNTPLRGGSTVVQDGRCAELRPGDFAIVDGARRTGSRAALTEAALDEVERSLGDPDLTPTVVASRVGISTRYLHQLFSARDQSFGRRLAARRLERCRADLGDPALAELTIGEIGWRNGFTDPSYLARAFRRAYGVSPGEHRRAAASAALPDAVLSMTS